MGSVRLRTGVTTVVMLTASITGIMGQTVSFAVTVEDSASTAPLPGASIELMTAAGQVLDRQVTNGLGNAVLTASGPGSFALTVTRIGYAPVRLSVRSGQNAATAVEVSMTAMPLSLDPISVSSSRSPQTALDAPTAVSVIDRSVVDNQSTVTLIDHIRSAPGVEMMSTGLVSRRYSVRGQNFGTSSQMRTFTDFRSNALPAQSINLPYLFPATGDDIERIEILRGPAASIWGPHTHRGVLHLVTRSPFEGGTHVSIAGGNRSVMQATLRHAQPLTDRVAFKISGEFFRGDDWQFTDPMEQTARNDAITAGANPADVLVGARDFQQEWAKVDGRIDWRPGPDTEIVTTAGLTRSPNVFDAIGFSGTAVQFKDASLWFAQTRVHHGELFANVYASGNSTDNSYVTSNGFGIVDHSRAATAQIQHALNVTDWQRLQYGIDATRTMPRTDGTTHQGTEDIDNLTEAGAYLHSETALSAQWDVIASIRADYHSVFDDFGYSPRLAVVFKPDPTHALHASYTSGFSSPGADVLFNDFPVGSNGPYDLRLVGMRQPLTFRRDCGGPCMRSPFAADPSAFESIDATRYWDAVVAALMDQGVDLSALPAPSAAQVQSQLATLDVSTFSFVPVTESFIQDLPAWSRGTLRTFEFGYKGVLQDRLSIGVDLFFNEAGGFVGRDFNPTANVFMEQSSLEAYLGGFMPAAQAAQLAAGIAMFPLGTITPEQSTDPVAMLLIEPEAQGITIDYWGFDVALTAYVTDEVRVSGNYSWQSEDEIPNVVSGQPFQFYNPKHSGAVTIGYDNATSGLVASIDGRAAASFPAFNAFIDGVGEGYMLLDATIGYELPGYRNVALSVTAHNVFDNNYQTMPGTARNGRLLLARVKAGF